MTNGEAKREAFAGGLVLGGILGLVLGGVVVSCAHTSDADKREAEHSATLERVKAEMPKRDCWCGATRTCAFGPGIVGEQHCQTLGSDNEWSRCEPKEGSERR